VSEIVLRKWQAEAIPLLVDAVKRGKAPVLAAFMGAGKSIAAAELVRRSKERPGYSVIVAAPRVGLVEQLAGTFGRALGPANVGMWHGGKKQADRRVVVATYQSLGALPGALHAVGRKPALLICDEAHRTETEDIIGSVDALRAMTTGGHLARIAITATAFRSSKKEALSLWDEVVYRYPYEHGLRDGVIVSHRVVGWDGIGKPDDVDAVTADMLASNGLFPALADAGSVADAEAFAEYLCGRGMPALAIHSKLKKGEGDRRITALQSGELKVLVHVSMLAEGSDFPWLRTLALRRNIGARVRFVQQCGRVLRVDPTNPEKREGIILDPLDLMGLHGLAHPEALGQVFDEGDTGEDEEKPTRKTAAKRRQELEALEGVPLRAWLIQALVGVCGSQGAFEEVARGGPASPKQIDAIGKMLGFLRWWPHKPTKDRIRAWVKDGRIATATRGEAGGLISLLRWLADASKEARAAQQRGDFHLAANLFLWPDGIACPDEVPRLDPEGRVW
jgi:superfamily II DNA or RNA helicase